MTPIEAAGLLPFKKQLDVLVNASPWPEMKSFHRGQIERILQRAEYIRPTVSRQIHPRFGLAVDSKGETLFIEVRKL
jgi:hypothetical protein